ncbi:hypothetical protein HUG20_09090 [Salicibibacter cibi]|uniref:Uncharacterized protein n=1 Tax=Salicibibacter cibi TaxID=2743001 RepID=A0A7T7CFD1_9BACI|nr:hypothetical protein [Salicibibacter cibi]QQK80027.1 hypothetical protein HUG20_09090 [Salicibibacter cibi]
MEIFGEFIPLHIFLMLCAIYLIGFIWGWRGPRLYRRDRFFSMKGAEFHEDSMEDVNAGRLFDEGLPLTNDGSIRGDLKDSARREVHYHYSPPGTNSGASWSYYIADHVLNSRKMIDYAKMAKLLGVLSLDLSPGWRMWPLRLLSHFVFFLFYFFAVGFMPVVVVMEYIGDQSYDPNPPWELLALGGYMIFVYMISRWVLETIQYTVQIRRSKKIVMELNLFKHDATSDVINKYLHRQCGFYMASYAVLIVIIYLLLGIVEPPYGIDW